MSPPKKVKKYIGVLKNLFSLSLTISDSSKYENFDNKKNSDEKKI